MTDIPHILRDTVKHITERELETTDGAVFSRTEVMRNARDRIQWKGAGVQSLGRMVSGGQLSRRQFLKMLGLGAGGAAVAAGAGSFFGMKLFDERTSPTGYATAQNVPDRAIESAPGDTVVQAGSLEDAAGQLSDGNIVLLAEGEYDLSDDLANDLVGGDKGNCSLIGDGNVVLRRQPDQLIRPSMEASADVRLQNISLRGKRGADQSRWRFEAVSSDATIDLINVHMPDGTVRCSDSTGIYTDDGHVGTINCINCSWQYFGNSACYVRYGQGPVNFTSCFLRNNSGPVRYFPPGSVFDNCVGVVDSEDVPGFQEGGSSGSCSGYPGYGRVIKVEEGEGTIQNSDFYIGENAGEAAGPAIDIQDDSRSSGHIKNIRIRNDTGVPAIKDSGGYADSWTAENICVIGSGSHEIPSEFEDAVTSNCSSVRTDAPWCYNESNGSGSSSTSGTSQ